MIHQKDETKLNLNASQRKALKRNLASQLILEERLKTTQAKAKFVQPFVEKLITRAGDDTVHNRREVRKKLGNAENIDDVINTLFEDVAPRFVDRPGGYTRILDMDRRKGDGAQRSLIEFVE
jgi:large subunit ribosomal protein L17